MKKMRKSQILANLTKCIFAILFISSCSYSNKNTSDTYIKLCVDSSLSTQQIIKNCTFALKTDSLDKNIRSKLFLTRGITHAQAGRETVALRDYRLAEEADPSLRNILPNRAQALVKLNRYDEAVTVYTQALRQNDDDAMVWAERGSVYLLSNRPDRALEDFQNAVQREPNLDFALYNGALAYARLDNHLKAIQWFTALEQQNPNDSDLYLYRGQSFHALQDYVLADRDYTQAISLAPDAAQVWLSRARLYDQTDREQEALEDYQRAFELGAQDERMLLRLRSDS